MTATDCSPGCSSSRRPWWRRRRPKSSRLTAHPRTRSSPRVSRYTPRSPTWARRTSRGRSASTGIWVCRKSTSGTSPCSDSPRRGRACSAPGTPGCLRPCARAFTMEIGRRCGGRVWGADPGSNCSPCVGSSSAITHRTTSTSSRWTWRARGDPAPRVWGCGSTSGTSTTATGSNAPRGAAWTFPSRPTSSRCTWPMRDAPGGSVLSSTRFTIRCARCWWCRGTRTWKRRAG